MEVGFDLAEGDYLGDRTAGPGERLSRDGQRRSSRCPGHGASPFSVAFVRFSPGARTAWHRHSIARTLYVTEGSGRVQSRGHPTVTVRAGEVVLATAGEWQWHGAAPDHVMTHLAVSEGDPTWGGQVTGGEYHADPG